MRIISIRGSFKMSSDEENQKPAKNEESSSEQGGRFDCNFIKKPSGFLMFINMVSRVT